MNPSHIFKAIAVFSLLLTSPAIRTLNAQSTGVLLNSVPSRVLGQPTKDLITFSPNYVEGKELTTPQGMAIDSSSAAPILYIADTGNNRVLAWKNPLAAANGAPADLIIGQRDRFSTNGNGPGTSFTTGLNQPTGLACDPQGNLYVVDTNNNRILRYPRPFDQDPNGLFDIDVILGQETFGSAAGGNTGRFANRNRQNPAANSLFFSDLGGSIFRIRMTFDTNGNLWVTDSGNNRVLRFPARVLIPGSFGPDADVALGQLNLVTNTPNGGDPREKTSLFVPSGIAFGADARLYVTDGRGRVLVYRNPTGTGAAADRILGVVVLQSGQAQLPRINDVALGSPESVYVLGTTPIVVDAANNRIVRYDAPDSWPAESASFSPKMRDVIGQPDFNSGDPNRGNRVPGPTGFSLPVDLAVLNNNLIVVDANNHRVITIPGGAPFSGPATRVLGQLALDLNAPNLVEGREFFLRGLYLNRQYLGGGLALDGNTLYIADTLNNRIMAYKDIRSIAIGQPADLIIGQASATRTTINSPDGNVNVPNQTGLFLPHGLAVDSKGDLWVSDTGNSRVLRFPRPFDNASNLKPNLVIGQTSFTSKITDASTRNMSAPVGLAFSTGGHLLVSDNAHNRVLFFLKPATGDFTNGQSATLVFGQQDFVSSVASSDPKRMNGPRGIAIDVDDRMYVVDSGNSRVHIYNRVPQAGFDPSPALTLINFNNPVGVTSDPKTAELWVTDGNNGRALRFPSYENLSISSRANLQVSSPFPLDMKVDQNSNLVLSDSSSRIAFFYQAQASINGANYQNVRLAPGTIAAMFSQGGKFADDTAVASTATLPVELADVQVLFNDKPAPLFFVSPNQINYQVPWSAPQGKDADVTVLRKSTGQVVASSLVGVDPVSPGFFTSTATGRGQISALNEDNTVNSITNPIARGKVIQLYGTGVGAVSNTPADGAPAPSSPLAVGERPDVFINGRVVAGTDVLFSGLAPGFVGLWQVNVKIPDAVPPGNAISVIVQLRSVSSQLSQGSALTTIAVKQ